MRASPLVASFSLCLLLAACGEAAVKSDTKVAMHVSDSEGSVTIGASIPADWPTDVPVMPGSIVTMSAAGSDTGISQASMVVLDIEKMPKDVQAYYTAELKKQGWVLRGTVQLSASTVVIAASKGTRSLSLQVSAGAGGKTTVTLAVADNGSPKVTIP